VSKRDRDSNTPRRTSSKPKASQSQGAEIQKVTSPVVNVPEVLSIEASDRMLASDSIAAVLLDPKGHILRASSTIGSLLGLSVEKILRRSLVDLLIEDDISVGEGILGDLAGGETAISGSTLRFRDAVGNSVSARLDFRVVPGTDGNICLIAQEVDTDDDDDSTGHNDETVLNILTEQTMVGIFIFQDNQIKYANRGAAAITEYSEAELRSFSPDMVAGIIHELDRSFVMEQARRKQSGDRSDVIERYAYRIHTKSGKLRWIDQYSTTCMYGGRSADLVTVIDITEQKRIERVQARRQERYRDLADLLPQAYYEMDLTGAIQYINNYGLELSGYRQEDIDAGLSGYDMLVSEDRERIMGDVSKVLSGEGIDNHEYRLQRRDGQVLPILIHSTPIIENNRPVGLWGLVVDISKAKQAEKRLRISDERYSLATTAARIGVWDWNIQTDEFYLDPGIKEMLGYQDVEIPNDIKVWANHIHPDDHDAVMAAAQAHLDGRTPEYVYEHRMMHKDGSVRWFMTRGQAIRDVDGSVIRMVGTDMDITSRREAETALRASEEKYHNLFESSHEAVIIVGHDGTILDCNSAALQYANAPKSDLVGRPFYGNELFQIDNLSYYLDTLRKLLEGAESEPFEAEVHVNNDIRWFEIIPSHLSDYNGQPAVQVVARDVTDRKRTEQALKEIESRHREILENARDVIYRLDLKTGTYDYVSKAVVDMLGYSQDEIIVGGVKYMRSLVHPDDLKVIGSHRRDLIASQMGDETPAKTEYRIRGKDGKYHWLSDSHTLLRDASGVPSHIIGSVRDISERKASEQILRDREEHLRTLLDTANSLIFCLDKDARITVFNKECERVTGYTQAEVMGKSWLDILLPADHYHHDLASFSDWVREHPSDQYEGPLKTKSGEVRTILWSNSAIFSPDSDELTALAVGHDITEYKATVQALGKSEERFREMMDLLPQTIFEVDLDLKFVLSNKHGIDFSGYTQGDIDRGLSVYDVIPPKDHQRLKENVQKLLKGEPRENNCYHFITRDGRTIPVLIYSSVIFHDGQPVGLRGVVIDITDRMRAEEALALSEERYRTLVEDMPALMCRFDLEGNLTFVNAAYCRYFNTTADKLIGQDFFQFIPEQEIEKLRHQLQLLTPRNPNLVSEHQVTLPDGEVRWQEWRDRVLLDESRRIIGYQSIGNDITDRKRSEEILRESEEKYRILVENADQAIFAINIDGIFLHLNEVAIQYLGDKTKEYVGRHMSELFLANEAEFQMKYLREAITSGRRIVTESKCTFPMGRRWFKTVIQPTQYGKDNIPSALLIAEDISERKNNELRNTARLQLLDRLRNISTINDLLAACCLVLRDSGFYNRSVFLKVDKSGKVVNRGDVGYDASPNHLIKKSIRAFIKKVVGLSSGDKYRIRKSYLVTGHLLKNDIESGLKSRGKDIASVENVGFRLFVPVINEENRYDGWLMAEGTRDQELPTEDDVAFLEELVEIVAKDMRRIEWVEQLNQERVVLHEKNIALKEVLEHIEEEKQSIKQEVAKNVDQNLLPALKKSLKSDGTVNKRLYDFVINGLESLASVSGGLMRLQARLSPREVEICNLIKSGLSSQEIADTLYVTLATVKKHRETIRKKFDIANKKVNLASFLKDL